MIRALIVDDEKPARRRLRRLLERAPDIGEVVLCSGGAEAVRTIRADAPDLVFLDVQMPEVDGFDVLNAVGPDRMPITVFVTAYDRYALSAFDARAIDYLLKPYSDERFEAALHRALRYLRGGRSEAVLTRMQGLLETVGRPTPATEPEAGSRYLDRIAVRRRGRFDLVRLETVAWIEAQGAYVRLHTSDRTYLHRTALSALEQQLDPWVFVRIHRSHIVRVDAVRDLLPDERGGLSVRLHDGAVLRVGRTYRASFERRFGLA